MNWFQNPFAFAEDDLWAKFTAGLEILELSCKLKLNGWFELSWVTFPKLTTLLRRSILLPSFGSTSELSRDALVRCETNFLAKRDWKKIPNTCICKVKIQIKWTERMFSKRRVAGQMQDPSKRRLLHQVWNQMLRHLLRQRSKSCTYCVILLFLSFKVAYFIFAKYYQSSNIDIKKRNANIQLKIINNKINPPWCSYIFRSFMKLKNYYREYSFQHKYPWQSCTTTINLILKWIWFFVISQKSVAYVV